ncbi:hypothetical protein [Nitratiruptor sp. YY09-18]|uniref:hypothetical protein n=1 Tax=Nitratiruptor sp. YY09-18 TaxID=2724901 RepID=UPI001914F356|nr:hypothetical protein [Nitratiruptor sp. YY09-18]BCD67502.1 hypothetical protein NitYY0918_C0397 [Nitratiruptor sp. YY09-18]
MIIFGHPHIPNPSIMFVKSKEEIAQTPASAIVAFDFDFELLRYCQENNITCAAWISSITEAVYANALEAKFLLCNLSLAKEVQKVAENYLFDAKVIAKIDERLIEKVIEAGIDGVLLTNYTR